MDKRALVVSGGGEKGVFAVGVLKHLLAEKGLDYDILGGVSVGCLITAMLAQHGHTPDGYAALEALFLRVDTEDIHRSWLPSWMGKWLGYGWAVVSGKTALRKTAPLRHLIAEHFDAEKLRSSGKQWFAGAVDLTEGKYVVFDETHDDFAGPIEASAAFPALFEPVRMQGHWYNDGGLRTVTPIQAAIERGATRIDIIMLTPPESNPKFDGDPTVIDVSLRSLELQGDAIIEKDLRVAQLYNAALVLSDELERRGMSEAQVQQLLNDAGLPINIEGKRQIEFRVFRPDAPLPTTLMEFIPAEAKVIHRLGYEMAVSS